METKLLKGFRRKLAVAFAAAAVVFVWLGAAFITPAAHAEEEIKYLNSYSLALGEDLTVSYYADERVGTGAYLKVSVDGIEGEKTIYADEENAYTFKCTDLAPQLMNKALTATLYSADGQVKGTETTTVATYCKKVLQLGAEGNGVSEKQFKALSGLIVDLLNYGAASQDYVGDSEAKCNAFLTEEGFSAFTGGTYELPVASNFASTVVSEETKANVKPTTVSLLLDYNVSAKICFEAKNLTIDGVKATMEGKTVAAKLATNAASAEGVTEYSVFVPVSVLDMQKQLSVTLLSGGNEVGYTVSGNVAGYLAKRNATENTDKIIAQKLFAYASSATAYANTVKRLVVSGAQMEYMEGDLFSTEGMTVQTETVGGTLTTVTEYDYDVKTALTSDVDEIIISYDGTSVALPITVKQYSVHVSSEENDTYSFEAEDADLSTYELTTWAADKAKVENSTSASGGSLLGNLSAASGYIDVKIYSTVTGKVTLFMRAAYGNSGSLTLSDSFQTSWNGVQFTPNGTVESKGWSTWQSVMLETVTLNQGVNVLRITFKGTAPNVDRIDFEVNNPAYASEVYIENGTNKSYRFEAENADTSQMTLSTTSAFIATNGGSGGKYLSNMWAQSGSFSYTIYSEVEARVSIYFCTAHLNDFTVADCLGLAWNGTSFSTSAVAANTGSYTSFTSKTYIATLTAKKGENVLTLTKKANFANLDYIEFEVNNPEYACDVRIAGTGTKWTLQAENCAISGMPANGKTSFTEGNGSYLCCLGRSGNTVTFKVWSDVEREVSFIICGGHAYEGDFATLACGDVFTTTLNGNAVTLSGQFTATGWTTFEEEDMGNITLNQGENTIVLTVKSARVPNIDYFAFATVQ